MGSGAASGPQSVEPRPPSSDSALETQPPRTVAPVGWRRTVHGWERAEQWGWLPQQRAASELTERIRQQRAAEPAWWRSLAAQVQSWHPVSIALTQAALACLIASLAARPETVFREKREKVVRSALC
jgi:hypothetical protein